MTDDHPVAAPPEVVVLDFLRGTYVEFRHAELVLEGDRTPEAFEAAIQRAMSDAQRLTDAEIVAALGRYGRIA